MMQQKAAGEKSGFHWLNVSLLTVTHHIHDIFTSFVPALQDLIMETFSLNNSLFGFLSVVQRIPTLFNPFIGIMAEKIRIRYAMIVAPTLTAVAMSLMGNVPDYISLVVLVFVSGIGSSLFHVPTPVMMRHISGKKPGLGMGFYMFGGELARTIGPIIAVGAVSLWGFSGMFRLIPAGILSSALLYVRFRKIDLRKKFHKEKDEGSHWKILGKYGGVLGAIAAVTLLKGGLKSIFVYYIKGSLVHMGWEDWKATLGLSVIYLTGTAGSFLAGMVSDHIGRRTTLFITTFLPPVFVFIYYFGSYEMSLPFLALIGFVLLGPTPVFLSIVNTIKSKHVTFLNGVYMTSIFLMSAIATMLTGTGLDLIEDYNTTLLITAIAALLAVPVVLIMPVGKKEKMIDD